MPELPELFLMSKFINDISMNIAYTHIEIPSDSKVKCDFDDLPSLFTISSESRGKELLISFSNYDKKLSMTMGMSGTFMYVDRKLQLAFPSLLKNIRFAFITASGSKLALVDHRRFAKWKWNNTWAKNRGFDPIKENYKFNSFILDNYGHKDFEQPLCDILLNQKYFNGIGNYLRSTILFYLDVNPFQSLNKLMESEKIFYFLELCKEVPSIMIQKGGGQLKDWKNPWGEVADIKNYIYYNKGLGCKDKSKRTFWFNPKWKDNCPYEIKYGV